MWIPFGDIIDCSYILIKPYTVLSYNDHCVINSLFHNDINFQDIERILELKRPYKIFKHTNGRFIMTIDNDYPEYFISDYDYSIYKFTIFKKNHHLIPVFIKYINEYNKFIYEVFMC